jgi:hypothetical protein
MRACARAAGPPHPRSASALSAAASLVSLAPLDAPDVPVEYECLLPSPLSLIAPGARCGRQARQAVGGAAGARRRSARARAQDPGCLPRRVPAPAGASPAPRARSRALTAPRGASDGTPATTKPHLRAACGSCGCAARGRAGGRGPRGGPDLAGAARRSTTAATGLGGGWTAVRLHVSRCPAARLPYAPPRAPALGRALVWRVAPRHPPGHAAPAPAPPQSTPGRPPRGAGRAPARAPHGRGAPPGAQARVQGGRSTPQRARPDLDSALTGAVRGPDACRSGRRVGARGLITTGRLDAGELAQPRRMRRGGAPPPEAAVPLAGVRPPPPSPPRAGRAAAGPPRCGRAACLARAPAALGASLSARGSGRHSSTPPAARPQPARAPPRAGHGGSDRGAGAAPAPPLVQPHIFAWSSRRMAGRWSVCGRSLRLARAGGTRSGRSTWWTRSWASWRCGGSASEAGGAAARGGARRARARRACAVHPHPALPATPAATAAAAPIARAHRRTA